MILIMTVWLQHKHVESAIERMSNQSLHLIKQIKRIDETLEVLRTQSAATQAAAQISALAILIPKKTSRRKCDLSLSYTCRGRLPKIGFRAFRRAERSKHSCLPFLSFFSPSLLLLKRWSRPLPVRYQHHPPVLAPISTGRSLPLWSLAAKKVSLASPVHPPKERLDMTRSRNVQYFVPEKFWRQSRG